MTQLNPACDPGNSFLKNIYPPQYYNGPAITFLVLSTAFFILIIFALKNLVLIITRRKPNEAIRKPFIINILILFTLLCKFGFVLDGPLQLFTQGSGLSAGLEDALELFCELFLNALLAFSSYTWLQLIFVYKKYMAKRGFRVRIKSILFY